MTAAGLVLAGLAVYVALRRGTRAGLALGALLIAVGWWGLAYAVELSVTDISTKSLWGDLKYLGVITVAPAWLVFALQYTGRAHLVTPRFLTALAVEPIALVVLLFVPATHDLVHFYPADAAEQELPVVGTGPVFWVHLVYSNAIILVATVLFVATMVRLSRIYRQMALVLLAAALLPWAANLLHNFEVGWFARLDLTPFAFTVTGGVLVWGVFRERLVRLAPLARGVIVERMTDAVFVLDVFGRVADMNPAAAHVFETSRRELIGQSLSEVLVQHPVTADPADTEGEPRRIYDVRSEPLTDRRGRPAGGLVIMRDVTARTRAEQELERLLAERSRVAEALAQSLAPGRLPSIPGCDIASRYQPAGDGSEIGGDFYDIFTLSKDTWGMVLGDVSGKGAEAAAVSALARITLRTLADHRLVPSSTLRDLNRRLLASTEIERHCTLVYAQVRPTERGLEMTLCLAGHHPPLVARSTGAVEPVGRLGTALGLVEEAELYDVHVLLEPGDQVCLFTDGLVEASNGPDLFGSERVAEVLGRLHERRPEELLTELVDAVRVFHGRHLADDLALLLLRVCDRATVGQSAPGVT